MNEADKPTPFGRDSRTDYSTPNRSRAIDELLARISRDINDELIAQRDEAIRQRDEAIAERDYAMRERDTANRWATYHAQQHGDFATLTSHVRALSRSVALTPPLPADESIVIGGA